MRQQPGWLKLGAAPLSGAGGGFLLALLEGGRLAAGQGGVRVEIVLPLAVRLVLLGAVAGLLTVPVLSAARGAGRKRCVAAGLGLLLCSGLLAGWLVLSHRVSRESAPWVSLFFFWAGLSLPALVLWLWSGLWIKGARGWPGAVCLLAGGSLVFLDPRHLRGTYLPLDLLLLGAALGLLGLGFELLLRGRRGMSVISLLLLLLAVATFWGGAVGGGARLFGLAPRWAFLERMLFRPVRGGRGSATSLPAFVDELKLFSPPRQAAASRARWNRLSKTKPPRGVLWITIDALRPDVTGLGGGRATPYLDRLMKEAVAFPHAYSQASGTMVSVESMFRSRYPGSRYPKGLDAASPKLKQTDFPTLATLLGERGFRTAMLTGVPAAELKNPMFRLIPVGFQQVIPAARETDALETARDFRRFLGAVGQARFFCWVHLFDPHAPYVPREGVPPAAAPWKRYLGEVRHADRGLGMMIEALQEAGRAQDTIVIVHADHGEAFGEHGRYYHSSSYYQPQIHVPLVVRVPGIGPGRVPAVVENVALAPTLFDLLHLAPAPSFQGISLLPVLLQKHLPWPRAAFAESLDFRSRGFWSFGRIRMATDGRYKLLDYLDDSGPQLFDLSRDPLERVDLAADQPGQVGRLLGYLAALDRRLGRAVGDGSQAKSSHSFEPLLKGLWSPKAAVRTASVLQIAASGRHDMTLVLEKELARLPLDTEHHLLCVLGHLLLADASAPPTEISLPKQAGPVRFRLLLRYGFLARYKRLSLARPAPPLCAFDELALSLGRAARGSRSDQEALKRIEPAPPGSWDRRAQALALGGDGDGAALLVAGSRGPFPGPRVLLPALWSLVAGRCPELALLLMDRWPCDKVQLTDHHYRELVEELVKHPSPSWIGGLLALRAGAPGETGARLDQALVRLVPTLDRGRIGRIASAWQRARLLEGRPEAAAPLAQAVAALPPELPLPSLREELARARWLSGHQSKSDSLRITVQGVPEGMQGKLEGPPKLLLAAAPGQTLALGPAALDEITLYWSGPKRVEAARLYLPRLLLKPGRSFEQPVALKYPRQPGHYRLLGEAGGQPLPPLAGRVRFHHESRQSWSGPAVARLFSPPLLPLRLLGQAAGLEIARGTGSRLGFPPLPGLGGPHQVSLTLRIWSQDPAPCQVKLQVAGQSPVELGALSSGRWKRLEGKFHMDRGEALALVFPDRPLLVEIREIRLR